MQLKEKFQVSLDRNRKKMYRKIGQNVKMYAADHCAMLRLEHLTFGE